MEHRETFLTVEQLSERWGLSVNRLNYLRLKHRFPESAKRGGIKYPISEIERIENLKELPYGIKLKNLG